MGITANTAETVDWRSDRLQGQPLIILDSERLLIGDLTINLAERTMTARNRREIGLSGNEFTVLATLVKSTGSFVRREDLLRALVGDAPSSDTVIDIYVNYLRKKFVDAASGVTIDKGPLGEYMLRP